jgi:hypothetical protein
LTSIPAEATAFLATHGRAYLYVLDSTGKVRGWPMIARHADGALVMTSYRKAPKVPHLAAAARATVVVTSDEGSTPFRYAVVEGPLKLTDITPDMADEVTRRMHGDSSHLSNSDYSDDGTRAHFRARLMEGKRVLIEVGVASAPMYTMAEAS